MVKLQKKCYNNFIKQQTAEVLSAVSYTHLEIQRKLMETAMDMHLHTVETSYLKQRWTR